MKYYFAARYSRHPEMRRYRDELTLIPGVQVTSRWIDLHGGNLTNSVVGERLNAAPAEAWPYGAHDLEDLLAADAIVSFTEPADSEVARPSKGGRHVEHGFALALHMRMPEFRIIVVGPRENIFHTHPATEQYDDWRTFFMQEVSALGFEILRQVHPSLIPEP